MHTHSHKAHTIVEKQLGIPADYQYRAIRSKNFLQANWHKNKLTVLEHLLGFTKHDTILDLGTGSGNFELHFSKKVKKIIGVDYNDEPLSFLHKQLKKEKKHNVHLVQSDIRDLTKIRAHAPVDMVIAIDVIEHIPETDAVLVVKHIKKLIKKHGKVCIITPNYRSAWILLEAALDKTSFVPKFQGHQHLAKYHKQNLNKVFSDNGFTPVSFRTFNTFSFIAPFEQIAKSLCKLEVSGEFLYGNMIAAIYQKD